MRHCKNSVVWDIVYYSNRKFPTTAGGCLLPLFILCRNLKEASCTLDDTVSAMLEEHIKLIEKTVLNLRQVFNSLSLSLSLSLSKIRYFNAMKSLMKGYRNANTLLRNKLHLILKELKV